MCGVQSKNGENVDMRNNILDELHMSTRDEVVSFLKSLWSDNPMPCPVCGGKLDYMHKKAKKSSNDWKCTVCGKVYKAVNIFKELTDE